MFSGPPRMAVSTVRVGVQHVRGSSSGGCAHGPAGLPVPSVHPAAFELSDRNVLRSGDVV